MTSVIATTERPRVVKASAIVAEAGAKLLALGFDTTLGYDDREEFWAPGNSAQIRRGRLIATVLPQYDGTARVALYVASKEDDLIRTWVGGYNYKSAAGVVKRVSGFLTITKE